MTMMINMLLTLQWHQDQMRLPAAPSLPTKITSASRTPAAAVVVVVVVVRKRSWVRETPVLSHFY